VTVVLRGSCAHHIPLLSVSTAQCANFVYDWLLLCIPLVPIGIFRHLERKERVSLHARHDVVALHTRPCVRFCTSSAMP